MVSNLSFEIARHDFELASLKLTSVILILHQTLHRTRINQLILITLIVAGHAQTTDPLFRLKNLILQFILLVRIIHWLLVILVPQRVLNLSAWLLL